MAEETPAIAAPSARSILLGSGPRFARDAFLPLLVFYVLWRTVGLVAGIAAATVVSLVAWRLEVRAERPGIIARVTLGFVLLQATVGLLSHSATVYLAQPVLLNAVMGLAFLGSALAGRPLAGAFAGEMYDFPPEVRASDTFRRVFGRVSMAWGVYMLARSVVRLIALSASVERYLVINFATGAPLMAGLMAWSIWYGVAGFRRSEEWGWAFEG